MLSISEKVEQHIKKKDPQTQCFKVLVEGGVNFLYGLGSDLIIVRSL